MMHLAPSNPLAQAGCRWWRCEAASGPGLVMGPGSAMMGSTNLLIGGPPATKLSMPSRQNGVSPNTVGATIAPSQIRVMSLR